VIDSSAASTPAATARKPPRGRMRAVQKEFTRTRFVDAAVEVFAERGYARATVDEIAERAGATRATFYLHFKTKSDVVLDLMARNRTHFRVVYQDLGPIVRAPTPAAVRGWLAKVMDEWAAIASSARPVLEARTIEPDIHEISEKRDAAAIVELANALRFGSPDLSASDAKVYASVLLAPLSYYFSLYIRGQRFDRRRVLDVLTAAWLAVITRTQSPPIQAS
jgi:AcrR family transcriptional regulator